MLEKIDMLAAKMLAEGRMLSPFALVQALLAIGGGGGLVRLARTQTTESLEHAITGSGDTADDGTAWGALADHYDENDIPGAAHMREHGEQLRKKFLVAQHDGNSRSARDRVLNDGPFIPYPLQGAPDFALHVRTEAADNGDDVDPTTMFARRLRDGGHYADDGFAPSVVLIRHIRTADGGRFPVPIAVHPKNVDAVTADAPDHVKEQVKRWVEYHYTPPKPTKLARPAESDAPLSVAYVSPSTREGGTIEQAYAGLVSPGMRQLQDEAHAEPAVGFWSDGAEESGVIHAPAERVAMIAEEQGRKHNQKAVLWFTETPIGPDKAHVLAVPDNDAARIHQRMMKHGIEYKTVIPRGSSSEVHVIDIGGDLTPQIAAYASEARAAHQQHTGHAHFLALKPL